jgi:hypothetical protein
MFISIYFIWQKNKKMDEVLHLESKRYEQEQPMSNNKND